MLDPGDHIDIWVVEKALGSGGMGSVYQCRNRTASRIRAAVKVLDGNTRRHPEATARFVREAEILFQLDHPNIVKVRNVRTDVDPPYLEMEFVEGESLESRLQRGTVPWAEALPYMAQIASAVAYLHGKGVRHRDIKPANLLVKKDGKIKLVDFGLAMEADASRITQQGMSFGTVSYAPPEWINPDGIDPAKWDLYAIGVVFYEILTGRVAFPVSGQGNARQQAMQVIVSKQGHPPLDPGPQFHEDVRQLIREMTHADHAQRLADASRVHQRVAGLRRDLNPVAAAAGEAAPAWVVAPPPDLDAMAQPGRAARARLAELATAVGAQQRMVTPMPAPSLLDAATAPAVPVRTRPAPSTSVGVHTPELRPPARTAGRRILAPLVALALAAGLATLMGVGAAAVWWFTRPFAATRALDVVVTGVPPAMGLGVRLGGMTPDRTDGAAFSFDEVALGAQDVTWVVGQDCPVAVCPGLECPAWCGHGVVPLHVEPGEGAQLATLSLDAPAGRSVVVQVGAADALGTLAGAQGAPTETGITFGLVLPGRHTLLVGRGTCEASDLGCDAACPPGCVSTRVDLVVPWGTTPYQHAVALPEPVAGPAHAPRPARPAPVGAATAVAAAPVEAPGDPSTSAGACVTNAELASWLRANPEWQAEAAVAARRGDARYLQGWRDLEPPAGKEGHAATYVSWYLAAAYCRGRGGLASVDAPPQRWTESATQPWIELRQDRGKGIAIDNRGVRTPTIGLDKANSTMGFRCAK